MCHLRGRHRVDTPLKVWRNDTKCPILRSILTLVFRSAISSSSSPLSADWPVCRNRSLRPSGRRSTGSGEREAQGVAGLRHGLPTQLVHQVLADLGRELPAVPVCPVHVDHDGARCHGEGGKLRPVAAARGEATCDVIGGCGGMQPESQGTSVTVPSPAYTYRTPKTRFNSAKAGSPVQCPGAISSTRHWSWSAVATRVTAVSGLVTRCSPPKMRCT